MAPPEVELPVFDVLEPLPGLAPPPKPPKLGLTRIDAASEELLLDGITMTVSPSVIELALTDCPLSVILVLEVML